MNKITIKIPKGIRYISDWSPYSLPKWKHCIVDKGVTGCGYTELCLTNRENIVLCSPRKMLLENKRNKHLKLGHTNICYLENKFESGTIPDWSKEINSHISKCDLINSPIKFLVTYDSLNHFLSGLIKCGRKLEEFIFVVDECQCIFMDAFYKASVEFNFVEVLRSCPSVIYLSATPMLDKYLLQTDEFKDLDYYKLDWSETGCVENIILQSKKARSFISECLKIITKYLNGDFPTAVNRDGEIFQSKEAVFYFNSVTDILRIIKKSELSPKEVNILCSDTPENKAKIRKLSVELGEKFDIGTIPLEGETCKMFTFCTKTVYVGVDFHSPCASSYIFSDPNIDCMALDIYMDLPQIVGRQRNMNNPFKNNITIYYKTNREKITYEEFKLHQETKLRETQILIEEFMKMSDLGKTAYLKKLRDSIKVSRYRGDFVSISDKTGNPVYNHFVFLANERAWEVSQRDYQDKISVTKSLQEIGTVTSEDIVTIQKFKEDYNSLITFKSKMKLYCKYMDAYRGSSVVVESIRGCVDDLDIPKFYEFFGSSGCGTRWYVRGILERDLNETLSIGRSPICDIFEEGKTYTNSEIRRLIGEAYIKCGNHKKPKASDILNYFDADRVRVSDPVTKKRDYGYRIKGKREI